MFERNRQYHKQLNKLTLLSAIYYILFSFISIGCKKTEISKENNVKTDSTETKTTNINDYKETDRKTQISYIRIGNDIPTFKIIRENNIDDSNSVFIESIAIYDSARGKFIQKIDKSFIKKYNSSEDAFSIISEVHFEHLNFDDYLDIFLEEQGMRSSCGLYLLYNKSKNNYEYAKGYEGMTDIRINKEKKLLYSFSNGGGGFWWAGTYKLIRNKPFLIEEEDQDFLGNDDDIELYRYTRKVRNKRGKLITVESIDTNAFLAPKYFHELH